MTLTLPARETEFAAAAARAVAPLVVVTTYTDRTLGTVDAVHYLSDRPLLLSYDGSVQEWDAGLRSIGEIETGFTHLPEPDPRSFPTIDIELANVPTDSGTLFSTLNDETLRFARIEVARVFFAPWQGESHYDLRAIGADQHRVMWQGEVASVEGTEDGAVMQLRCRIEVPALPWIYASDPATNDIRDVGKRLPIVYGKAKRVRAVGLVSPFVTTLADDVSSSYTGALNLTSTTGLPSSGTVQIGAEQLTYSAKSDAAGTITVSARGANSTTAGEHGRGDALAEVLATSVVYGLAGHEVDAVGALYVRSPVSGDLVRLSGSDATINVADDAIVAGKTIATASVSVAQFKALWDSFRGSVAVTQQPRRSTNVAVDTVSSSTINNQQPTTGPSAARDGNTGTGVNITTTPGGSGPSVTVGFPSPGGTITSQTIRVHLDATTGPVGGFVRVSVGGFSIGTVATGSSAGWYEFATAINSNSVIVQAFENTPGPDVFSGVNEVERNVTYQTTDSTVTQQPEVAQTALTEVSVSGLELGSPLELYADIDGPVAPPFFGSIYTFDDGSGWNDLAGSQVSDTLNEQEGTATQRLDVDVPVQRLDFDSGPFSQVYDFDDGTNWNALAATHTSDTSTKDEGTAAQRIAILDTLEPLGDVSDWSNQSGVLSKVDDAADVVRGSSSLAITGNSTNVSISRSGLSIDADESLLGIWVKIPSSASLTSVRIFPYSALIGSTNWRGWTFGPSQGMSADGVWRLCIFDPSSSPDQSGAGSFDPSGIVALWLTVDQGSGTHVFRWDDQVVVIPKTSRIQKNDLAAINMAADGDNYRIAVRSDDLNALDSASLYLSPTSGTGTAKPVDRMEISLPAAGGSSFVESESVATQEGTPGTLSSVRTIGVELVLDGSKRVETAFSPALWVDDLRAGTDSEALEWTATGGTISDDPTHKAEGTHSVKHARTVGSDEAMWQAGFSFDLTGLDRFAVRVSVDDLAKLDSAGFRLVLSGDVSATWLPTNYAAFDVDKATADLTVDVFGRIIFDLSSADATAGTGWDGGTVRFIGLQAFDTGSGALEVNWDDAETFASTARMQRNALASLDWSADSDSYRITARIDGLAAVTAAKLYVSDTAGSGTTPPSARREITIPLGSLVDGTWSRLTITASDVSSPDETSVQTLGLEVTHDGSETVRVYLDDLRARDDTENPYSVSLGTVLEHPGDVLTHVMGEMIASPPLTLDVADVAAWISNVPDSKAATDFRDLGESFWRIVKRLAFEARANLDVRAGVLQIATALSTYAFAAPTVTLTGWQSLSIRGRDPADVQTEHGAFYDLDRSGDRSEDGFLASLRADQATNDITSKVPTAALTAAREAFDVRDGDAIGFLTQRELAGVRDAFGYRVAELIRDDDDLFEFSGCDHSEALAIEPGDTFNATPDGEAVARKLRCVSRRETIYGLPDISAVEVL